MFSWVSSKTVTVKAPNIASGTTGYGTAPTDTIATNWGNAFRGRGSDGSGTVNVNIALVYQNP
jgi:hypothetical protein